MPHTSSKEPLFKRIWRVLVSRNGRNWIQKGLIVVIFSLVANHIAASENFQENATYRFPIEGFLFTIVVCILVGILAHLNFQYYKKKHFSKKVEMSSLLKFMGSTLGYITLLYIPINIIAEVISGGNIHFYYIFIGLVITLLICALFISLLYAQELYKVYQLSLTAGEITIDNGVKMKKLTYEHIACFYSENKIVYTVQNDGSTLNTDFTLNALEAKINDQLFFRANRQIIIHKDAVDSIEKIENGKLRIRLKDFIKNDAIAEITISRYKRKDFLDWYQ